MDASYRLLLIRYISIYFPSSGIKTPWDVSWSSKPIISFSAAFHERIRKRETLVRPTRNNSPNPDSFMPVIETLSPGSTATLLSRTKPEEADVMDGVIGFCLGSLSAVHSGYLRWHCWLRQNGKTGNWPETNVIMRCQGLSGPCRIKWFFLTVIRPSRRILPSSLDKALRSRFR